MKEVLNEKFKLFSVDLLYIQSFVANNFGRDRILLKKNSGQIPSSNYSLSNSRIKGYAFHGYGCLFQFKDYHIDTDVRFNEVGFTLESLVVYLRQRDKGMEMEEAKIREFLDFQVELGKLTYFNEGVYVPK